MAAWSTDRATIKTAIDGLTGYIIIPQNRDPEDSPGTHNHRAYSLKLKGVEDSTMHTNSKLIYTRSVEVLVKYLGVDDTIMVTNEGLFDTLVGTIAALTSFISFNSEPTLEVMDDKHLLGTVSFQFGISTN
jgi:hypothetical protein